MIGLKEIRKKKNQYNFMKIKVIGDKKCTGIKEK